MPHKDTATSEPSDDDSVRKTAPALPKAQAIKAKIDKQTDLDDDSERITVRKVSSVDLSKKSTKGDITTELPPGDLDDSETDKAVDDIMAKESDMVLAVDDILAEKRNQGEPTTSWIDKLKSLLQSRWTWLAILIILVVVFAIPASRYRLLGLVIKRSVGVVVIDSQTDTPVSNALISASGASARTDANGKVEIHIGVGLRTLRISKLYYRVTGQSYFVGLKNNKPLSIKLDATGRLVPITIDNTISGQPISGALIRVLATTAKTNKKGQATIALPATRLSDSATISNNGYNSRNIIITISSQSLPGNVFNLTPAGKVYYLTHSSATIDVTKSNLDGTDAQTVLAGSGHETSSTTKLVVSHDWHYLVLEANRSGNGPALYLINTANDQTSEFDSTNAAFDLIGWHNHDFIYELIDSNASKWQSGSQIIKDYNADSGELNQLDQSQALGDSSSYAYQSLSNFYIVGDTVVYDTQWTTQGGYDLSGQNDTIRAFNLVTKSKTDYESFAADSTGSIAAKLYRPQVIYFATTNTTGTITYYEDNDQTVQTANIDQSIFNQASPTYYLSPSDAHSLWSILSNGQDLFFVGDSNAANQRQVVALDNFTPYGWFTDNYLLATQGNDQLYILPESGLNGNRQPFSIANFYEPNPGSSYQY